MVWSLGVRVSQWYLAGVKNKHAFPEWGERERRPGEWVRRVTCWSALPSFSFTYGEHEKLLLQAADQNDDLCFVNPDVEFMHANNDKSQSCCTSFACKKFCGDCYGDPMTTEGSSIQIAMIEIAFARFIRTSSLPRQETNDILICSPFRSWTFTNVSSLFTMSYSSLHLADATVKFSMIVFTFMSDHGMVARQIRRWTFLFGILKLLTNHQLPWRDLSLRWIWWNLTKFTWIPTSSSRIL